MSSLALAPTKTALVIIDLQHGIVSRATKPYPPSQVVDNSRALAEALRAKGGTVVYVHVDFANYRAMVADEPARQPGAPPPPPEASEIVPSAGMQPGDLAITKYGWGAFAQTELEQQLRSRGIETVILTGIATNMGVESTLRHGTGLGFDFVTVEDACSTFTSEMHAFAFQFIFPRLSRVRTTAQILEALA
ncbi:isochorismatase family protein [Terriglobus albidus]|uniref:Isochorismatase family protein n=1 Tax=Terriglobus albidus TaxID=1592106 RepID=A0A5B9E522_9BACT|nr:isochorismatase family protein [Terriglobus albidus]QEE26664.1 isochorismatase family protein [Terriglobus albidus]